MHSSAAVLEDDVGNNDSVEQKALELIRRFNDPDREHVLRGLFEDTDSLAEVRAKQRRAEIEISRVFSELVILRGVVGRQVRVEPFRDRLWWNKGKERLWISLSLLLHSAPAVASARMALDSGILAVLADEDVGGAVDVEVGGHIQTRVLARTVPVTNSVTVSPRNLP